MAQLQQGIDWPSSVWQALLDIRDACQEHCIVSVPRIGAKNIFVPMICGRAMLHDVGSCLQLSWEHSRSHASNFSGKVIREHPFGDIDKDVGCVEDDMVIEQGVGGSQLADEPQFSRVARITTGHMAKPRLLRAKRSQRDEMAYGTAMHMNAHRGALHQANDIQEPGRHFDELPNPQNTGADGFMALAEQDIEERPHGKITCRQRTEGRSARLIFIFGVADDFDELSCLVHLRELFAEYGREFLRKNIDRMAGVVPF